MAIGGGWGDNGGAGAMAEALCKCAATLRAPPHQQWSPKHHLCFQFQDFALAGQLWCMGWKQGEATGKKGRRESSDQ